MKCARWLASTLIFSLIACKSQTTAATNITLIDAGLALSIQTNERIPLLILTQAGLTVGPNDRIYLNGIQVPLDQPAPIADGVTLQIRRSVALTISSHTQSQVVQSTARTVGEALTEAGIQLYASDFVEPAANIFITGPMTINYIPSRELSIQVSGKTISVRSSAATVGEALAEAGIPLIGLDYSSPSENEAVPEDGQIKVVHVNESVELALKSIPYTTEYVQSTEIELGTQKVEQPGQEGLAVTRTRVRYEDGQEVNRTTESEAVLTQPQTRIMKTGSQASLNTITVDGETLQYWRAFQMYATIYSPCSSGHDSCSYSTASGMRAGRGVVAVDPSMYSYLQAQRIYISGYGYAVIGDIGGGYVIEDNLGVSRYRWIDLGFDDGNIVDMSGWLTVYFLAPVPASIPPVMQ
jgi:uncharacterized protein YabE (DUF348 family)